MWPLLLVAAEAKRLPVKVGNGHRMFSTHVGTVTLMGPDNLLMLKLERVLHIPEAGCNVISVSKGRSSGMEFIFHPWLCALGNFPPASGMCKTS
jgi:hypothetical protein